MLIVPLRPLVPAGAVCNTMLPLVESVVEPVPVDSVIAPPETLGAAVGLALPDFMSTLPPEVVPGPLDRVRVPPEVEPDPVEMVTAPPTPPVDAPLPLAMVTAPPAPEVEAPVLSIKAPLTVPLVAAELGVAIVMEPEAILALEPDLIVTEPPFCLPASVDAMLLPAVIVTTPPTLETASPTVILISPPAPPVPVPVPM
jgi:hypothetical protein